MNAQQYTAALTTLSLTSRDVCAWLGVSRRGEALWRENGPSNLAGRLIEMQLVLVAAPRMTVRLDDSWETGIRILDEHHPCGRFLSYADIAPLLAVGEGV